MPNTVHLRGVPPPDDTVLIIRGGERSIEISKLRSDADKAKRTMGILGVSVSSTLPGEGLADAWASADVLVGRQTIWWTTAGELRAAGFPLLDTGRDPRHYTIVLASTDRELLEHLARLFTHREDRR